MKNQKKAVNSTKTQTGKIPNNVGFSGKGGGGVLITKTPQEYANQFIHMT